MGKTRGDTHSIPDAYLDLIHRFPLRPIRNDGEHEAATEVLQDLIGRDLNGGEEDYYETLLLLVTQYEEQHHGVDEEMEPLEALRALMEANGMRQADLARTIGSQPAASMILNGQRSLSKAQIIKLCDRFKVSPDLFMGRAG